jgi:hypothetical protein
MVARCQPSRWHRLRDCLPDLPILLVFLLLLFGSGN